MMSLSVGTALQDGWTTFRRTPWTFVFFVLFAFVLSTVVDLLPGVAGYIVSTLVDLWATVGLIRGAWLGLNRERPSFGDLIRIDAPAIWRLFSRQFLLTVLLGVISATAAILAVTAADAGELAQSIYSQIQVIDASNSELINGLITEIQGLALAIVTSPVAVLVLLLGAVIAIYIQVNQMFLGFLAVVKGLGPIATLREGFRTVQTQWWTVFGLQVMQLVILLLGLIAFGFGLLAAIPVVVCITASAYRQLFDGDDPTGVLTGR